MDEKREARTEIGRLLLKEVGRGSSVPSCRSNARHLISCGNMQNAPAEEVPLLCCPWQRYHFSLHSHTHTHSHVHALMHNLYTQQATLSHGFLGIGPRLLFCETCLNMTFWSREVDSATLHKVLCSF